MSLFAAYFNQSSSKHDEGSENYGSAQGGSIMEAKEELIVPKMKVKGGRGWQSISMADGPQIEQSKAPGPNFNSDKAKYNNFTQISINTSHHDSISQSIVEGQMDIEKMSLKLIKYIKTNEVEKCSKIISRKLANVNYRSENEWTPLHFAVWIGNIKIVNLLMLGKASVNSKARNNLTPLMVACNTGNHQVFNMLLTAGANFHEFDTEHSSCLHYAAQGGNQEIIQELINLGLSIDGKNRHGKLPEDCAAKAGVAEYLRARRQSDDEVYIPIFSFTFDKIKNMFSSEDDGHKAISRLKVSPQDFDVLSLLGRGSFGEVYLVKKKDTEVKYAMKVLLKHKIMGNKK